MVVQLLQLRITAVNTFIRLADAIAGFLRDAMEGDEDMQKLHSRAIKRSIVKDMKAQPT